MAQKKDKTSLELFPKLKQIKAQWSQCADCNDPHPGWADISRGILICINCSGVHRNLGTHVSKVQSLTLDNWKQEWVDKMQSSNLEFNKKYEYHVDKKYMKPTMKTRRELRDKYIRLKYIGVKDYGVTKQLIPAFHEDQFGPLAPVFASDAYDEGADEKSSAEKGKPRKVSLGMTTYTGVLMIHVICATDLPKADLFSDSDPYVVFHCNCPSGQSVKTKVIMDNNNPKWNQQLMLSVDEKVPISITIYDEDDHTKDDLLCSASLHVQKQCKVGEEVTFNMAMDVNKEWKKQNKHSSLTFKVKYEKYEI
eukprot:253740_1